MNGRCVQRFEKPRPLALVVAGLGIVLGFAVVAAPSVVSFGDSLAGAIDEVGSGRSRPLLLVAVAIAIAPLGAVTVAALPIRGDAMLTGPVLLLPLAAFDRRRCPESSCRGGELLGHG